MKSKDPGYHPGASCVCTYNDKRLFIVSNLNVLKKYNVFVPFLGIFTNLELISTPRKTTLNFSISNFLEIDMGGVR